MIAFSNMLFSEGICKILENNKEITVTEVLQPGAEYSMESLEPMVYDVILTDLTTLYNAFPDIENSKKKSPFILLDTNCGRENIVSAILKKKISGVIPGCSDSALLKKAIKAVAKGDVWIDKTTVKNLLHGINALGKDKTAVISDREKEIVALTGQGLRNKEIAQKLNISEPTVKTHLHRIFQKLNISSRSELITYAIKNNDVGSSFSGKNVQTG